jgi:hypothetical protein
VTGVQTCALPIYLSISSSTLASAVMMCCFSSFKLAVSGGTKECLETNFHLSSTLLCKLCVHYTNGFDNVGSVYFFYSNPVL